VYRTSSLRIQLCAESNWPLFEIKGMLRACPGAAVYLIRDVLGPEAF